MIACRSAARSPRRRDPVRHAVGYAHPACARSSRSGGQAPSSGPSPRTDPPARRSPATPCSRGPRRSSLMHPGVHGTLSTCRGGRGPGPRVSVGRRIHPGQTTPNARACAAHRLPRPGRLRCGLSLAAARSGVDFFGRPARPATHRFWRIMNIMSSGACLTTRPLAGLHVAVPAVPRVRTARTLVRSGRRGRKPARPRRQSSSERLHRAPGSGSVEGLVFRSG